MRGHAVRDGLALTWAARTDIGRVRSQNQDNLLAGPGLFVVADGMGGHAEGAAAAASIVEVLGRLEGDLPVSGARLRRGVQDAAEAVIRLSGGSRAEPGSTLTALVLGRDGDGLCWLVVNVGDSRTYRLLGERLIQLTTDHSAVQELLDAHVIDAEQARVDPRRNILTRALGAGMTEQVAPDLFGVDTAPSRFLLCSDGLTNEVDDATIRDILSTEATADAAADRLVRFALDAGARDNVTVIVVDAAPDGFGG